MPLLKLKTLITSSISSSKRSSVETTSQLLTDFSRFDWMKSSMNLDPSSLVRSISEEHGVRVLEPHQSVQEERWQGLYPLRGCPIYPVGVLGHHTVRKDIEMHPDRSVEILISRISFIKYFSC